MSGLPLANAFLHPDRTDTYFHFGLTGQSDQLKARFGDTKFVLTGGSAERMRNLAADLAKEFKLTEADSDNGKQNLIPHSDRFVMYKSGPIICINHGMGAPSITIMLHELAKLLNAAGCNGVTFIRVGTCGGIGVQPGTVCITTTCLNTQMEPYHYIHVMGKVVQRPAEFDANLVKQLESIAADAGIPFVTGTTLTADDFYEEQGRTDGAICEHTEAQKMQFLRELQSRNVQNIEMESLAFAAFTKRLGIRAACMAVVLVNRLQGDAPACTDDDVADYHKRILTILVKFIRLEAAEAKEF